MEAQGKLDAATQRNKLLLAQYDRDEAQWKRFSDVAKTEAAKVNETAEKLNREEDFQGLLKSFLSLVFDETLQCVAAKRERASRRRAERGRPSPSTSPASARRRAGRCARKSSSMVRKDGHEISLRSGCSGGQQAVIELAVDLALAEVIAERTGVYPGWLVLDEPFDGLGAVDKEACMEVLSQGRRGPRHLRHRPQRRGEVDSFDSVIAVKYATAARPSPPDGRLRRPLLVARCRRPAGAPRWRAQRAPLVPHDGRYRRRTARVRGGASDCGASGSRATTTTSCRSAAPAPLRSALSKSRRATW
jgi:hypothetical protein